jgi:hypothetical protein
MSDMLWTLYRGIDLRNTGHKAPAYRQTERLIPSPRVETFGKPRHSYTLVTRRTEAIAPSWLQPEAKEGSLGLSDN